MISAQSDKKMQEHLIDKYMKLPNQVWNGIIQRATQNVDVLKDEQTIKQLKTILKTNVRAVKSVGHPFVHQVIKVKE